MKAYLVSDNNVTDHALFAEFARGIFELVKTYNGTYLVRGGATTLVVGPRTPNRTVIIEFESMERAKAFTSSPEYQALADMRSKSSDSTTFLVEGV